MESMTIHHKKQVHFALFGAGTALLATSAILCYRLRNHVPRKDYRAACLYLAVMDDEICRNELEGTQHAGRELVFPPKIESLPYRYRLFLAMNKGMTRADLDAQIQVHERRLARSKLEAASRS